MPFLKQKLPDSLGIHHYLFGFALLIRVCALWKLSSSPLLIPKGSDMFFYDNWAQQLLRGVSDSSHAFYGLPLYPYLLALLYKAVGYNPFVPALVQSVFDAGTAALICKVAVCVFGRMKKQASSLSATTTGIIASLGWNFFAPAETYSVVLMPTAFAIFTFWFVVWQLVKNERPIRAGRAFLYGALVGFVAMGVATVLFVVPLVLMAIVTRPGCQSSSYKTKLLLPVLLLLIGVASGTAPCWMYNKFVAHDPVFLSAHSGVNFWLGNNPEATGYPHFPGLHGGQAGMLHDSIAIAEEEAGKPLSRSEVSAYWSGKATNYITHHFSSWLRLLGHKAFNFVSAFEYDDINMISRLREQGIVETGLHFGLVAALAIPGLLLSLQAFPKSRWIVAGIVLQLLAILPVFVTERYRLGAVPGLLLFAALGVTYFWDSCRQQKIRHAVTYLAILAFAAAMVSVPRRDPSLWALKAYSEGTQALEANDLKLAETQLLRAQAYVPSNPETDFALGNLRLAQGIVGEAKSYFTLTLAVDPNHKGALNNLGVLALKDGDWQQAADFFRTEANLKPNDSKSHFLLARAELGLRHRSLAEHEISLALQLQPNQPEYNKLHDIIEQQL